MIIFQFIDDISAYLSKQKQAGKRIGFVPTMGALHKGHLSLIETSKLNNQITVCSIFVNPTQFNDANDFEKYPKTTESDIKQLIEVGCDVLFLPSTNTIYPEDRVSKHYELGNIELVLEGKYRTGHFQGVCKVVDRLLTIIKPHQIILGQKDLQQCLVVKKLLEITKSNTQLIVSDIIREDNGLAMSSRNMRLTEIQKEQAAVIYQSILFIKNNIEVLTAHECKEKAKTMLLSGGVSAIDYVEICEAKTLIEVSEYNPMTPSVVVIAVFIGEIRLIDNMFISEKINA